MSQAGRNGTSGGGGSGVVSLTAISPLTANGVSGAAQTGPVTIALTTPLTIGFGGTAASSFNINGAVFSNTTSTGALQAATLAPGQLLIGGNTAPAAAYLTAGSGITITPGNHSIEIAASGSSGISTIDGDSGSITGSTVTIYAGFNSSPTNCGGTVAFINSGTISLLNVTDANFNVCIGYNTGNASMVANTCISNVALGQSCLPSVNGGIANTAIGNSSLNGITSGVWNSCLGSGSGGTMTTGSYNNIIGVNAGSNYNDAESSNILIGAYGVSGENTTTRIGYVQGSKSQTACFIDGIAGVTVSSAAMVTIDTSTGQMGSATLPSGGITTIDGDSGSITGSTVTIYAHNSSQTCGSSVAFVNSGTTSTLNVSDSNSNTIIGDGGGNSSISASSCTGVGVDVLTKLTSGNYSTFFGVEAGYNITSGQSNTGFGYSCLNQISTTAANNAFGYNSLAALTSGNGNTAIGHNSGYDYTGNESYNVCIGYGVVGVNGESNAIHIADSTDIVHAATSCFIGGIYGATVTGSAVLCASNGQLGTIASSIRYKENVNDLQNESRSIYALRPVSFNYKGDKDKVKKYGLIAEEVEKVFPDLVIYGKEKDPQSVAYHDLPVLLLNELQRLKAKVDQLEQMLCSG